MKSQSDTALPVVKASELDEPDENGRWLVDKLWPRLGVGIIGGAPKCGKSWLGLDLAVSIASGTACLGTFHVAQPGGVLVYMAEDAAATVKQRLLGICNHRRVDLAALPIGVITAPTVRLDVPRDQRRLTNTVRHHRPRLVVLDPFVRLHRINENQAGDVAAVLGYLRELQRAHDLALVVVHHARKNGGPTGGQSLRGSGDFFAWVDTALFLRRQRQQLVLSAEHRAASSPQPVTLTLAGTEADMHLEIVSPEAIASAREDASGGLDIDDAVLGVLHTTGDVGMRRDAIRQIVRARNERLGEALARLAAAGHIRRDGDRWVRRPVPIPPSTYTNGNGNGNEVAASD